MTLLLSTVLLRPYVFLFFAIFLFAAIRFMGWQRALGLTAIAWITAFIAEFSSTRIGIPFGDYVYIDHTRDRELWISNIPFFDSFSFTFLAYSSYMMALAFILPLTSRGAGRWMDHPPTRQSGAVLALSVLFFTFIDIVIDPLAVRGDRWFLGRIFYYPEPGLYFGVPIANFMGWAVVGFISIFAFQRLDRMLDRRLAPPPPRDISRHVMVGVGLYYLILGFNLFLTFAIGERLLGMIGIFIYAPVTVILLTRLRAGTGEVDWRPTADWPPR